MIRPPSKRGARASAFWPILLALAASGCAEEVPLNERVVVDIGGRVITAGEFDSFVESSVQQDEPFLAGDVMEALFEQFIEEKLLLRAAEDAGIRADPKDVARRLETIARAQTADSARPRDDAQNIERIVERQIRIETLVEAELFGELDVTDSEISSHFEANRAYFGRPETVEVSQILVEEQPLADEILSQLRAKPAIFEELATQHSIGPEARRGGALGSFGRGELPPSLEEAVFSLRKGRISEVVATDFGFHIFRVHEKMAAEPLPLEAVRDSIRVELLRSKSDHELARYIEELKNTYPVTIHREHLSFAFLEWEDGERKNP